jgi:hypothetical protein
MTTTTATTATTCSDRDNHRAGAIGCPASVQDCQGIPAGAADLVTSDVPFPREGECGVYGVVRAVYGKLTRVATVDRVPFYAESNPYGRPNVRPFGVWDFNTEEAGRVLVVTYESRGPLDVGPRSLAAVFVAGDLVAEAEALDMSRGPSELGATIAWRVARHIADRPAPLAEAPAGDRFDVVHAYIKATSETGCGLPAHPLPIGHGIYGVPADIYGPYTQPATGRFIDLITCDGCRAALVKPTEVPAADQVDADAEAWRVPFTEAPQVLPLPSDWSGAPAAWTAGKDVAKLIRDALKSYFPGVKFSVRTDVSTVSIRWTDGPTVAAVDLVANEYKGQHYDGQQERRTYRGDVLVIGRGGTRNAYRLGTDFVQTSRESSADLVESMRPAAAIMAGRELSTDPRTDYFPGDLADEFGVLRGPVSGTEVLHFLARTRTADMRGRTDTRTACGAPGPAGRWCELAAGHAFPLVHLDTYGRPYLARQAGAIKSAEELAAPMHAARQSGALVPACGQATPLPAGHSIIWAPTDVAATMSHEGRPGVPFLSLVTCWPCAVALAGKRTDLLTPVAKVVDQVDAPAEAPAPVVTVKPWMVAAHAPDEVDQVDADAITAPAEFRFASTSEAYDASQTRDDIRDGDLLLIESERVAGFLMGAYPVAVTAAHGELHTLAPGADLETVEGGRYVESFQRAHARAWDFPQDGDQGNGDTPAPVDPVDGPDSGAGALVDVDQVHAVRADVAAYRAGASAEAPAVDQVDADAPHPYDPPPQARRCECGAGPNAKVHQVAPSHTPAMLARAEVLGAEAYAADRPGAPAMCAEVMSMVDGWKVGEGAADVFEAFHRGFSAAADRAAAEVLAAPAEELEPVAQVDAEETAPAAPLGGMAHDTARIGITTEFQCPAHGTVTADGPPEGPDAVRASSAHGLCTAGDPFGGRASVASVELGRYPDGRPIPGAEQVRVTLAELTAPAETVAEASAGPVRVADLVAGDRAHVVGIDQYGSPSHATGYVQGGAPSLVTIKGRTPSGRVSKDPKKSRPGLLVLLAETPNGWNGWRMTIVTTPDATAERVTEEAHQFRPTASDLPHLVKGGCSCGEYTTYGASRYDSERADWLRHVTPAAEQAPEVLAVPAEVVAEQVAAAYTLGAEVYALGVPECAPARDAELTALIVALPAHIDAVPLVEAYRDGYATAAERAAADIARCIERNAVDLVEAEKVAALNPAAAWAVTQTRDAGASLARTLETRTAQAEAARTAAPAEPAAEAPTEAPTEASAGDDQGDAADVYTLPLEAYTPVLKTDQGGDLVITHDHEDGTVLHGSRKGDGVWEIIREIHGWDARRGVLFVRQSRDRFAQLVTIDKTAEALRAAGWTVAVEVDDVWRPASVREEARAERASDRAVRLGERASRRYQEANSRREAARSISDMMPFGEPIKIGHHSEARHRRAFDRIDAHTRASINAWDYAQHLTDRAAGAEANEAAKHDPRAIMRRIERMETDARDWERRRVESLGKRSTGYLRRCMLEAEKLAEDLAYQRAKLGTLAESGTFVAWAGEHFRKGDHANIGGDWCEVTRINRKGVSVRGRYSWSGDSSQPVTWDEIHGRRRDGLQWDAPNAEPWPIVDARRVAKWGRLVQSLGVNYDRSDAEESRRRRHTDAARRLVLGLRRNASAAEVDAFGEPADVAGKRARALAMLAAWDRLEAGETFDQVAADTTPIADTAPAWTMPEGEPVEVHARDLVPGDIVAGVYEEMFGSRRLASFMVGPVTAPTVEVNRHESGTWAHVTVAGEAHEVKAWRWIAAHLVGKRPAVCPAVTAE